MNKITSTDNLLSDTSALNGILRWMGMSIFVGAILTGTARRAAAATVTVTDTGDSGAGTLRDTIAAANAGDIIAFNVPNGSVINLDSQIVIDKPLTISGPGADNLTIQKTAAPFYDRLFYVSDNDSGTSNAVTISGVTMANGSILGYGGAIKNFENLTLDACIVSGNVSNAGGAIYNGGVLTIKNSTISNNYAFYIGGGVASFGDLTIDHSTVSGNQTTRHGGEVYNYTAAGGGITQYGHNLLVTDSTIDGNTATGNGGGIFVTGAQTAVIRNSTISKNRANTYYSYTDNFGGGGIASRSGTPLDIANTTISGNSTGNGNGGGIRDESSNSTIRNSTVAYNHAYYDGGGIFANRIFIDSTILSGNSVDDSGPDGYGRFFGNNNLISNTSRVRLYGNNNIYNLYAGLGKLQNNGGPTLTHALLSGSPCFNRGSNLDGLTTDQRGLPRVSGSAADIGAWEAQVKTFVVKNLNDSGPDSLRDCVTNANQNPGPDTVTFQAGLTGSIVLTSGQVNIYDDVTITGPGASVITVSGNSTSRVFYASDDDSSTQLDISISGLTISGGNSNNNNGAGIYCGNEHLTLKNSTITNNDAGTGEGGGVYIRHGYLTMDNCVVSGNSSQWGGGLNMNGSSGTVKNSKITGNTASYGGGGIGTYNGSNLYMQYTTVDGNHAGHSGGGLYSGPGDSYGPGPINFPGQGYVSIRNSTISNNTADQSGGGISRKGYIDIFNSTISGNSAKQYGGGISIIGGTLYLTQSTITNNVADSDSTDDSSGGGLSIGDANARLYSSIIAGNTVYPAAASASDVFGSVDGRSSYNIVGVDSGLVGITNGTSNNQVGSAAAPLDPQLGPLQDNGGLTFTHAITGASIAHDAGPLNGYFSQFDQRGPGFIRVSDRHLDIGAFEFQDPPLTFVVKNLNDSGPDSLRDCVAAANSAPTADIITFEAGLTGTITLTSSDIFISDHVQIVGPGANVITVSAANSPETHRIFTVGSYQRAGYLNVSISGLTLSGGNTEFGGAIANYDNLTVSDCVLSGNTASTAGGIGVSFNASLKVLNSTFTNNAAYTGGAIGVPIGSDFVMENSTLSGNSAQYDGGGVYIFTGLLREKIRRTGSATLRNNTITNNQATNGYGGGVFIGYESRQPNIPLGPYTQGGVFLTSNIIAQNTSYDNEAPDIAGEVDVSGANNLIGIDSGLTGISDGVNANQIGTAATPLDPLLGPLQINGGVVPTHALKVGSPALDMGSNVDVLASDERSGLFARDAGPATDIGAFENQLPVLNIGGPYTVAFGSALSLSAAATDLDGDTITYTWDINGDGTFGDATGSNPTLTSAQLVALGIGNSGTFTVTVQATDGFHTVSASTTLTVINNQPPVVEPPIVTPNPGTTGNTVTVTVSATDPNGLPLTFTYDWGDGTTSTSNTHVYANPGTYTVTVTVSNGSSSTTVTTSVVVALSMKATKLKGVTHFGKPGHDFAHLTTIIPDIKAGFSPAGKTIDVDFGGVKRSFTLDPHGKATTGDSTVRLQVKLNNGKAVGGATRLWVNLNKGDFAAAWKDEGLDPAKPLRKASVPFIVTITLDGTTYLGTLTTTANANANLAEFHTTGFK